MPLVSQNFFTASSNPRTYSAYYYTRNSDHHLKAHKFTHTLPFKKPLTNPFCFLSPTSKSIQIGNTRRRFFGQNALLGSDGTLQNNQQSVGTFNFDAFLSFLEFLCLVSSVTISVCYLVNYGALKVVGKPVFRWLGSGMMVWQWVVLVSGVVAGSVIRRRQWRRISRVDFSGRSSERVVSLVERIEKLEEDLRSSTTIVRVLSRQLEKLGIRFRINRKALKEPIAETAALAQKNSEATRALAAQEDRLEKELGEVQKVLLAMQEQQRKQLELILAIAKNGNLLESKREPIQHQSPIAAPNSAADGVPQLKPNQHEALAGQKEAKNETE